MKISAIVQMLVRDKTTVEQLAAAIGRITEKERRRYRLAVPGETFEEARIGFETDGAGLEMPRYVELLLPTSATLRVADLADMLGEAEKGVPFPSGNPHHVRFRYDKPDDAFLAVIDASLTGPPGEPETKIENVNIRREERL